MCITTKIFPSPVCFIFQTSEGVFLGTLRLILDYSDKRN